MSMDMMFGLNLCLSLLIVSIPVIAAGVVRFRVLTVLLRTIYLPITLFLWLWFYWFWGGDGVLNFWLVPILLVLLLMAHFGIVAKRWAWLGTLRGFDRVILLVLSSQIAAVLLTLGAYLILGQKFDIE